MNRRLLGFSFVLTFFAAAGCTQTTTNTIPNAPRTTPVQGAALGVRLLIPRSRVHPSFIAANTGGIELQAFHHGSRKAPIATVVENIAQGSPLCTNVANGRTCAFGIRVPPGKDDFFAATYDAPPSSGHPAGRKLGTAVATLSIAAGKANQLKMRVGGILASVLLSLPRTVVPAITPITQAATVTALDPDGNVILTDAYVDANAKRVSIALSADSAAGTTVSISPRSISAPGTVTVAYAPRTATNAQIQSGFTTVLVAVPSNGVPTSTRSLTVTPPEAEEFSMPSGGAANVIAKGSDGNLWFAQYGAPGIMSVTPRGRFTTFVPPNVGTRAVAPGLDGNVWFSETNGNVGNIAPASGIVKEFPISPGGSATALVPSSDGSMWFSNCPNNTIGRISTGGTVVEKTVPTANSSPDGIVQGSDGNMWFTEILGNKIGRLTRQGVFKEFTVPTAGGRPFLIANGPDGALWFTEITGDKIGRITTGGTFTEFAVPTSSAYPHAIVTGPDGAMWFTECLGNKIARIPVNATSGSQILEFTVPTGSSRPTGITVGPDGALWFLENATNNVARFQ